jgi:hypothetical protein
MANYVIDPVIKLIKENIKPLQCLDEDDIFNNEKMENYELANKLEKIIDNNVLKKDIISYISPRIYLDKDNLDGKFICDKKTIDESLMIENKSCPLVTKNSENKKNSKNSKNSRKNKNNKDNKDNRDNKYKKKKGKTENNNSKIIVEEIKDDRKEDSVFIKNNKKTDKRCKIYDKNGKTISSEYETPVDSDDFLEAIIGRKLNKERIYGKDGKK